MKRSLFYLFILIGIRTLAQDTVIVENQKLTITSIGATNYELKNKGELTVSSSTTTVSGRINFDSDSAWLIIDGILPSAAIAAHLSYLFVNGQPAVNKVNIRVTNYLQGCLIQPHAPTFEALSCSLTSLIQEM